MFFKAILCKIPIIYWTEGTREPSSNLGFITRPLRILFVKKSKAIKPKIKYRTLINGKRVREEQEPIMWYFESKCPSKWISIDCQSGQIYSIDVKTNIVKARYWEFGRPSDKLLEAARLAIETEFDNRTVGDVD
jgi:hypothetical protein